MTLIQKSFKSVNPPSSERDLSRPGGPPADWTTADLPFSTCADAAPAPASRTDWFGQLEIAGAPDRVIFWAFMRPRSRPCFTTELLLDLRRVQSAIREESARRRLAGHPQLQYVVLGSRVPGVYNLGGDLALLGNCIRTADGESLQRYADLCIDVVHDAAVNLSLPIITIALVQGDALGGGFEAALACNVIVAEKSAKFGLPEVLFNLFPGMGAYNFLSRRIGGAMAERVILSGRVYSADEMHAMGIVDLVVDDGSGERAVLDYVERNQRRHKAERAIYHARQLVDPVRLADLRALGEIWVATALCLSEADLRRIERLERAQERRKPPSKQVAIAAE